MQLTVGGSNEVDAVVQGARYRGGFAGHRKAYVLQPEHLDEDLAVRLGFIERPVLSDLLGVLVLY